MLDTKYNPDNHCWPAIRRSVTSIAVYSILLSIVETLIAYEIIKPFEDPGISDMFVFTIFGLLNSIILRRYVCIISEQNPRHPRMACHCLIFFFSFAFIKLGTTMEHNARAQMYHSQTLSKTTFNDGEYYYIDSVGTLDSANSKRSISYKEQHFRYSSNHRFSGYYVAPFSDRKSVFYVAKCERDYSTGKYTKGEGEQRFSQEFGDFVKNIKPAISNHLFRRIPSRARDYRVYVSCIQKGVTQRDNRPVIEEMLTPVKDDRMPRWTDVLWWYILAPIVYVLLLLIVFCFSKTELW